VLYRTRKISGCDDGACPRVDDTTYTATVAVQGYRPSPAELAAMNVPDGEGVVLLPRSVLEDWARAMGS